jgi:hypothetical protein
MNPIGAILTTLMAIAVCAAPRRLATLLLFAAVCYLTQEQSVIVSGFHFTAIRIVLLAAFIRTIARGELGAPRLTSIDWAVMAYASYSHVVASIRIGAWQEQIGNAYNVLLSYFVFRSLVSDWDDVKVLLRRLAILIIPLALFMILESETGKSVFSVIGAQQDDFMRQGRFRCRGAFRGSHTAGIFGATLAPLFIGLSFMAGQRRIASVGVIAATAITYSSNSSGPLMAYLSGLVGLLFWPLRREMRPVRWGLVLILVALALVMKAPIWYLAAKISALTGGDGWHRSYLMEQCFRHFSEWWLAGTSDTADWAITQMTWGGADITNMYVCCAAEAGLVSLMLFILILVRCFRGLGAALCAARQAAPQAEGLLWCLGTVLFAHVVTLFSVTYWDQMHVVWWGFLAMISSVTSAIIVDESRMPAELSGVSSSEAIC